MRAISGKPRRRYDQWRDVAGEPIPAQCRVEQIAVASEHGATAVRLGKRGRVIRRVRDRLHVRFDGEDKDHTIRPHLGRESGGEW